jgi:hypothetical protein
MWMSHHMRHNVGDTSHAGRWHGTERRIDGDRSLETALSRYGVTVREPGQRPWSRPKISDPT